MGSLTNYFNQVGYRPTYFIGDRVTGRWNKIPFTGTVGNDRLVNHTDGPEITVHLDLPIRYQDQTINIIVVQHTDVRLLK
jgi:hypothetical protein